MERLEFLLQEKGLSLINVSFPLDYLGTVHKDGRKVLEVHEDSFYAYDQNMAIDEEILEIIKLIQNEERNQ